ncbi:hypothetical protein SDC9_159126 [bioreactor metagenome]|uniref:Uncharacterized protein n=1 Tax=bioreactor metagenome TaxID=1076179 RepID=A0A645FBT1_9ZZZZ
MVQLEVQFLVELRDGNMLNLKGLIHGREK